MLTKSTQVGSIVVPGVVLAGVEAMGIKQELISIFTFSDGSRFSVDKITEILSTFVLRKLKNSIVS